MGILILLSRSLVLFVRGRVHFFPESRGRTLAMEDGGAYEVFRHVRVGSVGDERQPEAVFLVRFKPYMSTSKNIRFSVLPMMVMLGFRGFREKYWGVDRKTGICQGLYQWQTKEDAENYSRSMAVRFMTNRSVPGSVHFEIIDQSNGQYWTFRHGEGKKEDSR